MLEKARWVTYLLPVSYLLPVTCVLPVTFLLLSALGNVNAQSRLLENGSENGSENTSAIHDDAKLRPTILELRDLNFSQKIWSHCFPDSILPLGDFQILIPFGPALLPTGEEPIGDVYLLRNGTEVARLDRAEWQSLTLDEFENAKPHKNAEDCWKVTTEGANPQEIPLVWKAIHWNVKEFLGWMEWPAGLSAKVGSSLSNIPTTSAQFQRNIEFNWNQKLYQHYLLGVSLHRSQFGGGLTQMALDQAVKNNPPIVNTGNTSVIIKTTLTDFWSDSYWWWTASLGVPGLKYTLSLANLPLPEYFWIDPSAAAEIRDRRSGPVINQWTGATLEKSGNFSHTIDSKIGYFRYAFHYDLDAYRFPINTLGMDDLPIVFGTWGAGLIVASDIMATRVWFNIPHISGIFPLPQKYPSNVDVSFLRFEFDYRTIRNFNLGLSVQFHLDNFIFNLPGV